VSFRRVAARTLYFTATRDPSQLLAILRGSSKLPRTPRTTTSKLPCTLRRTMSEPSDKSPSNESDPMREPLDEPNIEANPLDYSL